MQTSFYAPLERKLTNENWSTENMENPKEGHGSELLNMEMKLILPVNGEKRRASFGSCVMSPLSLIEYKQARVKRRHVSHPCKFT